MASSLVLTPNLMMEKNFRRLLTSTERHLKEKSIEDWKLDQFVVTLTEMLSEMRKAINRPNSKQLDDYKQRIDILRQNVDPMKLADQTFPRQTLRRIETPPSTKQSQSEMITPLHPSSLSLVENSSSTPSNRSTRPSSNNLIQQQIKSEEDKQDDIAEAMRITTKSLLNSAHRLNDIVKDDQRKLIETETLIDNNTAKLHVQSKRLKHNAYNVSNCWIYLMLLMVIGTFIYLTLFMRMFRKRITVVTRSTLPSTSNSFNQTVNNSNETITATQTTDYISFLINYANENHTDL
jgi:hypothetical protein